MTRREDQAQSATKGDGIGQTVIGGETTPARHLHGRSTVMPTQRDPADTLRGCRRILILGRTGSGKTTLARELAAAIGVPHVELDALYFGPDFTTTPLTVLRERTSAAIASDRWVTDGNKSAVRDLVWPHGGLLVEAREAGFVACLRPQSAGGRGGRKGGTRQAAPLGGERSAHGASITPGPAS